MSSLQEGLKKFGLSSYQAKVILALLKNPSSPAARVSEKSGVPMAKIYSVLDSLVDMGIVSCSLGRPKLYTALPSDQILSTLLENARKKIRLLEEEKKNVLGDLEELEARGRELRPVYFVPTEEGAWAEYSKLISEARRYVYNSGDEIAWDSGYRHGNLTVGPYVKLVQKPGFEVKCLYPGDYNLLHTVSLVPKGLRRDLFRVYASEAHEARKLEGPVTVMFSVIDGETAFLLLREKKKVIGGLFINDKAVAKTFEALFQAMFEKGVPVTNKMVEFVVKHAGRMAGWKKKRATQDF